MGPESRGVVLFTVLPPPAAAPSGAAVRLGPAPVWGLLLLLAGCETPPPITLAEPTAATILSSDGSDFDGYTASQGDCDDNEAATNPAAAEVCDGIDNNCNGDIDEGALTPFYPDVDGDGWGDSDSPVEACEAPEGFVPEGGDCDDEDPGVYPGSGCP